MVLCCLKDNTDQSDYEKTFEVHGELLLEIRTVSRTGTIATDHKIASVLFYIVKLADGIRCNTYEISNVMNHSEIEVKII